MNTEQCFLIGARGQVGTALQATASGRPVRPLTSADVDVRDPDSVRRALADLRAGDVVVNAAAHTRVDAAQDDAAAAYAVNADGPGNLAAVTAAAGARLIHLSTDYVFARPVMGEDGRPRPFEPADVDGEPATVYGASKLAGERAVRRADPTAIVVRTAWVFAGDGGGDFVSTMLRLERERDTVRVVDDQIGSPTYAVDLARGLWELADRRGEPGLSGGAVLHAVNAGSATWRDLAAAVFAEVGARPERVEPCTTAEFPRPAPRPRYSVLSPASWAAAGLTPLRDWREALHDAVTAR